MFKIKKGDTVKVIAGKDKEKEGKVLTVDQKKNKVVVEGINMITKHSKPSAGNPNGGIVQKEAPIDASNVMLVHEGNLWRCGRCDGGLRRGAGAYISHPCLQPGDDGDLPHLHGA